MHALAAEEASEFEFVHSPGVRGPMRTERLSASLPGARGTATRTLRWRAPIALQGRRARVADRHELKNGRLVVRGDAMYMLMLCVIMDARELLQARNVQMLKTGRGRSPMRGQRTRVMGHRVQWMWVQVLAARRNSVQAEAEAEGHARSGEDWRRTWDASNGRRSV